MEKKLSKLKPKIEEILDYKFRDINLLKEALTHSSKRNKKTNRLFNYERLEFFGDRILGFVVSEIIFKKFSNFQEGELNSIFQKYTNEIFLSSAAIKLKINDYIIAQKGDSLEIKSSILSDVIESITAAIYLDSGLKNAKKFVKEKILNNLEIDSSKFKHPKSRLQEFSLKHFKIIPSYSVEEKTGPDHNPSFKVKAFVNSKNISIGLGSNIQKAEENAAENLLSKMEIEN